MLGIYEDTYGSAEIGAGVYLIMAAVAFMMLQAAPAFIREVLSNARLWPVIGNGVAFWWLLFQGRPVTGMVVLFAGIILSQALTPKPPPPER